MLFIGQDLASNAGYAASGYFPTLGGVTTYFAFYQLNQSSLPAYGALGQDMDGDPVDSDVNWGAGQRMLTSLLLDIQILPCQLV
jgi:hypothetical protein